MGAMLFPLLVVVTAALAVIGFFLVTRYPVSTWRAGLRNLGEAALEKEEPIEVVPQDVHLNDLMTREGPSVYTGTDSFSGLVGVVEKAMTTAEGAPAAMRRSRAGRTVTAPKPSVVRDRTFTAS